MNQRTNFQELLDTAREIASENRIGDFEVLEQLFLRGAGPKEQLIAYLNSLSGLPMKADDDALRIIKALGEQVDEGRFDGIEVIFDRYDDPIKDQQIQLEFVRDRLLRVELRKLIDRLEDSPE